MSIFSRVSLFFFLAVGGAEALVVNHQMSVAVLAGVSEAELPVAPSPKGEAPAFPYWENVGMVGMGTGIYLGDGYVLTSTHVGCHPFRFEDGANYRPDYRTWKVLSNVDGGPSDVAIFRILIDAKDARLGKLNPIPLCESQLQDSAALLMIGTGFVAKDAQSAEVSSTPALGCKIDAKRAKRCGINHFGKMMSKPVATPGGYRTRCFVSDFDRKDGEAQAAAGDSGGASFCFNAETQRWELVGCIIGASQTQGYVPFGARTYLAHLNSYKDQLPAIN